MINFTASQYEQLNEELRQVEISSDNMLQRAQRSLQIVNKYLVELKTFIIGYQFKDAQEEIHFFRNIKPQFSRLQIYYREMLQIEANKPFGDLNAISDYYRLISERMRLFFSRNQSLYNYVQSGQTDQDQSLFIRGASTALILAEDDAETDLRFHTPASYKLSKLQAFELLKTYILSSTHPKVIVDNTDYRITWTESKAALVELLYALHSAGAFNHSQIEIKQLASALEKMFNVDLGNYYRTFQEIRIRKKNRTAFIDKSKEMLTKRMDDTDEYVR